jgi:hypothetical protein
LNHVARGGDGPVRHAPRERQRALKTGQCDTLHRAAMMVIGIDAGGTRTVAALADAAARVWRPRGTGANLHSEGETGVERVLRDLIATRSRVRESTTHHRRHLCRHRRRRRPEEVAVVRGVLERLLPGVPSVVVMMRWSRSKPGRPVRPRSLLISGTGSIAYGRDGEMRDAWPSRWMGLRPRRRGQRIGWAGMHCAPSCVRPMNAARRR